MSDAKEQQPQEPVADGEAQPLTAEQTLELERLKSETESHRAAAAESTATVESMRAERRGISERLSLTKAVAESGVKFHNAADAEVLLRSTFDVLTTDDGTVVVDKKTGKPVPLSEAFQHIALENPTLADGRSLRHLRGEVEADGSKKITSRSELRTPKETSDYISKFGLAAYEGLSVRPVTTAEPKTQEQFRALPLSAKTRFLSEKGLEWLTALPKEPTGDDINKRAGIKINRTKSK